MRDEAKPGDGMMSIQALFFFWLLAPVLLLDRCKGRVSQFVNTKFQKQNVQERRAFVHMSENETSIAGDATQAGGEQAGEQPAAAPPAPTEDITYHAVEKDGQVTAIWEMQGRKHLRTIDPRSRQGQEILRLYTADHHTDAGAPEESGPPAAA
jgi:hypothetical protein